MAGEPAAGGGEPAEASESNQPSSLERTLKAQGLNREFSKFSWHRRDSIDPKIQIFPKKASGLWGSF